MGYNKLKFTHFFFGKTSCSYISWVIGSWLYRFYIIAHAIIPPCQNSVNLIVVSWTNDLVKFP